MTKIPSIKDITLGDLPLALSTNEIPDFGYLSRSAGKILSINKTSFKLTGNTPSMSNNIDQQEKYQA